MLAFYLISPPSSKAAKLGLSSFSPDLLSPSELRLDPTILSLIALFLKRLCLDMEILDFKHFLTRYRTTRRF